MQEKLEKLHIILVIRTKFALSAHCVETEMVSFA